MVVVREVCCARRYRARRTVGGRERGVVVVKGRYRELRRECWRRIDLIGEMGIGI